jgi:hypothetical protein
MTKSLCVDCKFAKWDRTPSGAIHREGRGACTWQKIFAIAASGITFDHHTKPNEIRALRGAVAVRGGLIWRRGSNAVTTCVMFEPQERKT